MVRAFQAMTDRNPARGKIDDRAWNEKRRNTTRPFFKQGHGRLINGANTANAGTNHNTGTVPLILGRWRPAGISQRLRGGSKTEENELIGLFLILFVHPVIGIESAIASIAARNLARNLRTEIRHVKATYLYSTVTASIQPRPRCLNAVPQWGNHAHTRYDNTPHGETSMP